MLIRTPRPPQRSLFRQLLGTKADREISLSKAFAACFRESPTFRETILDLLWRTCRVRKKRHDHDWDCLAEVAINPQSRPDLHIRPADDASGPLFRIESKVAAPLRAEQLRRYRLRKRGEYLVAITKRPPEVGSRWIQHHGVFALRWQDVHRAVAAASARRTDGYLCQSLNTYLEELGMAHREDIRAADLKRVRKLFEKVTGRRNGGLGAEDAFRVAADCLAELDDLMSSALDAEPKLRGLSRWGPNYYKWFNDGVPHHSLAFHFHDSHWRRSCGAALVFFENGDAPIWQVSTKTPRSLERDSNRTIDSVCRDGKLDQEKMLRSFLNGARRERVVKGPTQRASVRNRACRHAGTVLELK